MTVKDETIKLVQRDSVIHRVFNSLRTLGPTFALITFATAVSSLTTLLALLSLNMLDLKTGLILFTIAVSLGVPSIGTAYSEIMKN